MAWCGPAKFTWRNPQLIIIRNKTLYFHGRFNGYYIVITATPAFPRNLC